MLGSSNPAGRRRLPSPSAILTADGNRANRDSQNDRIRHDLPKDIDLAKISRQPLSAVISVRNERPEKSSAGNSIPRVYVKRLQQNAL